MYFSDASSAIYTPPHTEDRCIVVLKDVDRDIRNISTPTMFTISYKFRLLRRKK
jgi:hypothetical protein